MAMSYNNEIKKNYLRIDKYGFLFLQVDKNTPKKFLDKGTLPGHITYFGFPNISDEPGHDKKQFIIKIRRKNNDGKHEEDVILFPSYFDRLNFYVKSFLSLIGNVDFKKRITINSLQNEKRDGQYVSKILFLSHTEKKSSHKKTVNVAIDFSNVPKRITRINSSGEEHYDYIDQEKYYRKILDEQTIRFKKERYIDDSSGHEPIDNKSTQTLKLDSFEQAEPEQQLYDDEMKKYTDQFIDFGYRGLSIRLIAKELKEKSNKKVRAQLNNDIEARVARNEGWQKRRKEILEIIESIEIDVPRLANTKAFQQLIKVDFELRKLKSLG